MSQKTFLLATYDPSVAPQDSLQFSDDVSLVRTELIAAIQDAGKGPRDLRNRIESEGGRTARQASQAVRARLEKQWNHLPFNANLSAILPHNLPSQTWAASCPPNEIQQEDRLT